MPQLVAFLRAINVTGRFVKMAVLAEHGRALGQSDSRFSNAVLERTLRQRCTLRRASMLQALSERLAAGGP